MKKFYFIISILLFLLTNSLLSQDFNLEGIAYNITSHEAPYTVEVASSNYQGDIVIPSEVTYQGISYSVTAIGEIAFLSRRELTSVEIPNSVTIIGEAAFLNCSGLNSVNIPNSVTFIGNEAFSGCIGLTSVDIPGLVTNIGVGAFGRCAGLTSINVDQNNEYYSSAEGVLYNKDKTIVNQYPPGKEGDFVLPVSVTTIGEAAFSECTGLTSIDVSNSVTDIGDDAFWGCDGLTSFEIPNSVRNIGELAFWGCDGLTSIDIHSSVINIGHRAFSDCLGLTSINVDPNNEYFSSIDGVFYNNDQSIIIQYPGGKEGDFVIPASVTKIGESAFTNCFGLTSVDIPNSVTNIGEIAFFNSGLRSIDIPDSVTEIGNYAFGRCANLTSVVMPNSITNIGEGTFSECIRLTSFEIPNSVTTIGRAAFGHCTGLITIEIPKSVTDIGELAFDNCIGLTSITSYSEDPPELGVNVFGWISNSIPLYVPEESISLYEVAEQWNAFDIQKLLLGTSISKLETSSDLKIYPNPVIDQIYIDTVGYPGEIGYIITNMSGQISLSGRTHGINIINIGNLEPGTYLLQLTTGDNWQTTKHFLKK